MKKLISTFVVLTVVILSGCNDNITNVQQSTSNTGSLGKWQMLSALRNAGTSTYSLSKSGGDSWSFSKNINGNSGGEIEFDKDYGNGLSADVSLNFKKGAFEGTKRITVTPDPDNFLLSFSPSISFNKTVNLDFEIEGLDLSFLNSNKKKITVDFAYIADDGSVEVIKNNGVKINIEEGKISVHNAKLNHFSRYAFITKDVIE